VAPSAAGNIEILEFEGVERVSDLQEDAPEVVTTPVGATSSGGNIEILGPARVEEDSGVRAPAPEVEVTPDGLRDRASVARNGDRQQIQSPDPPRKSWLARFAKALFG
jgi:hypothetical protein